MHIHRRLFLVLPLTLALASSASAGLGSPTCSPAAHKTCPKADEVERAPISLLSVERARGGWQARLGLESAVDALRVTLNGRSADRLFNARILGSQTAGVAPDDGLVRGRNVLTVVAVRDGVTYPARSVTFNVSASQILVSAGPDVHTRAHTPIRLDGAATLGLASGQSVRWRIVTAPEGSTAVLSDPDSLQGSFTPDRNGLYQIELSIRDPATGQLGLDQMTATVRPNYPPIGVGVETMASYNGSTAIVVGTNCAAEIKGCPPDEAPGQVLAFPYKAGYPVQLLILAREDLQVLWHLDYVGNETDAGNIASKIQSISQQQTTQGFSNPIVILAALGSGQEISPELVRQSLPTIVSKTNVWANNEYWYDMILNEAGWSAVGMSIAADTAGPAGYLNPRNPAIPPSQRVGDLTGYLQYDASNNVYNFVPGAFAAFNTRAGSSSTSNTMVVGGTSYTSEDLGSCAGGFHLVTLDAATLAAKPGFPDNRTFLTNCGNDTNDCSTDPNDGCAIGALANALNDAQGQGVSILLQSMGTPISSSATMQKLAAQAVSPAIEGVGGIGDAFNKSILNANSPSYALAGGGFLLLDAPLGERQAFGLEASGAAGAQTAAYLEGLLKRNQLWRYTPVAGGSWPTQAAILPQIVYQTPVAWPLSTPEYQPTLECIGTAMSLSYDQGCYTPAYNNVRAAYCDGGIDWGELSGSVVATACKGQEKFTEVLDQLLVETGQPGDPGVGNLPTLAKTIKQYQAFYTSQQTDSNIGVAAQVQTVLDRLTQAPDPLNKDLPVVGYWGTLMADSLDVIMAGGELVEESVPGMGLFAALGHLVSDFLVGETGTSQLGAILDTTAADVGKQLEGRYTAAVDALGAYQDMIRSDSGKLSASFVLPYFDDTTQQNILLYMRKGVQRFAYGRLLGAEYKAYGLLPTATNAPWPSSDVDPILSPAGYICQGEFTESTPFSAHMDSLGLSWVNFTYQNWIPEIGIYGPNVYPHDAPFLLALGREDGDSSKYFMPSDDVMKSVFDPVDGTGLGAWPTWFFRHNFDQVGFADCIPVRDTATDSPSEPPSTDCHGWTRTGSGKSHRHPAAPIFAFPGIRHWLPVGRGVRDVH